MICPIGEKCKHKDSDVTVLMCNECMANKLNLLKAKYSKIKDSRSTKVTYSYVMNSSSPDSVYSVNIGNDGTYTVTYSNIGNSVM